LPAGGKSLPQFAELDIAFDIGDVMVAKTGIIKALDGIIDVKAVDVPKYLILMIIPIGFFVLSLQFLRQIFRALRTLRGGAR